MVAVRTIIQDACIELGVLDPLESMDASMAQFGLRMFNRMLESMNTDRLSVYTRFRSEFPFINGQQDYTVGVGGNWVLTPTPHKIEYVSILSGGVEYPIDVVGLEDWQNVEIKTETTQLPCIVWARGTVPLETLSFWPVPSDTNTKAVLYYWATLGPVADLDTVLTLPDGYEELYVSHLAINLSGPYKVAVPASTANRARVSRERVMRENAEDYRYNAVPAPGTEAAFKADWW